MKILITGAEGFIGKNLRLELMNKNSLDLVLYSHKCTVNDLDKMTRDCDFVFHLAGVNRPNNIEEFRQGNVDLTHNLLNSLKQNQNKCPILFTSSIQATLDNPYGKSKKVGEDILFKYAEEENVEIFIYRLTNVFGKWCRPNYNSVVATFCHNIAMNLPIELSDKEHTVKLIYIDDVIKAFIETLEGKTKYNSDKFYYVDPVYPVKLGILADLLYSFKDSRKNFFVPKLTDDFLKKLYSTYLTYLPKSEFAYSLKTNNDQRGSFTEFLKTATCGQISVNVSKPGITKGNHWHHTKNEKFLVVSGEGVIRFKNPFEDDIIEYYVSDTKLEVVDIPPGYSHNISNLGDSDMVTIMWANEIFNPDEPDTYYLEVM